MDKRHASPRLPRARILSFQYDSQWYPSPDHIPLRDCGRRLMEALMWDRRHKGQVWMCPTRRKRPLIFFGHSFGGLVVKEALVLASQIPHKHPDFNDAQSLLKATAGIMFVGTPHKGSKLANWGLMKSALGAAFGRQSYPE